MSFGDVSQWAGMLFIENIQENMLQVYIKFSNTLSILARISYAKVLMSCSTTNLMITSFWLVSAHFQSRWWLSCCLALCECTCWLEARRTCDTATRRLSGPEVFKQKRKKTNKKLSARWSPGPLLVLKWAFVTERNYECDLDALRNLRKKEVCTQSCEAGVLTPFYLVVLCLLGCIGTAIEFSLLRHTW